MTNLTHEQEMELVNMCPKEEGKEKIVEHYNGLIEIVIRKIYRQNGLDVSTDTVWGIRNETYIRLFDKQCRRLKQWNPNKVKKSLSLKNWIAMIARQTAMDHIAKERSAVTSTMNYTVSIDAVEQMFQEESHETRVEKKMELHILNELLDQLTGTQKFIFKLYYLEKKPLSREDIAEMTGRSLNSVDGLLNRARAQLIDLMKDYENKKN